MNQSSRSPLVTIIIVVVVGLSLLLLWQLRSLLVILMVSIVIAATIAPIVDWAERKSIPRIVAVLLVYLGLIGIFITAGLIIGPTVIKQIQLLSNNLPNYLEELRIAIEDIITRYNNDTPPDFLTQFLNPKDLTNWLFRSTQQVLLKSYGITKGIIGGIFSLILALLFSGYIVADSKNLVNGILMLFPSPWDSKLGQQVEPMSERMGGYLLGRILVSGLLGVLITLGLGFLGLSEFALGLGVIAGFTNLIPFVGPFLGAVPALIVALSQGFWLFLWVILLFIIIQNLEAYVLDPLLVGSTVKIHPLYQLLAVLGGTQVLGILGAVIVPPWIAGASVLLENLYLKPKQQALIDSSQNGNSLKF